MSVKKPLIFIFVAIILGILAIGVKIYMHDFETHPYQLLLKEDDIEIRNYPPRIVAKTMLSGERSETLNAGFQILFNFISENDIPMTTPVLHFKENEQWVVEFMMPKNYDLKTTPKPLTSEITIEKTRAKEMAVIRFTGTNTDENLQTHLDQLDEFIDTHHLISQNVAYYAFFDPPWIPPLFRQNEILIEIRKN